tara:strand:+ start:3017 stop:3148 length:132 start_codon:yes stop_codon:yes gene_type:complete
MKISSIIEIPKGEYNDESRIKTITPEHISTSMIGMIKYEILFI